MFETAIVSLHFLPLARVFRFPAYYRTGVAGAVVSVSAALAPDGPMRLLVLGGGIGFICWTTALYLVWNADGMARDAAGRELPE